MRLAEPGRAADEQRVVGERRHLGDRERGAVGEPVGVADDELVEREARVEGDVGRRPGERVAGRGASAARRGPRAPTSRTATSGPSTRAAPRPGAARLKRSATHARLSSGAVTTSVPPSRRAGVERLEVELPGGVRHGGPELGPDAPPGMREIVVGHVDAESSSSPRRGRWIGGAEGPEDPGGANITRPPGRSGGCQGPRRKTRTKVRRGGLCTSVDGVCTDRCAGRPGILAAR